MGTLVELPVRVPAFIQWIYPNYQWNIPSKDQVIYLTFDDGPIPEVTPWVLDTLDQYGAKATFFCIGENVKKHPEIFKEVFHRGHGIGNHTFNHLKGWKSKTPFYVENVTLADTTLSHCLPGWQPAGTDNKTSLRLFRPPYGKIKRKQARQLQNLGYQIIMYEVVARDWMATLSGQQCADNVLSNVRPGSIVVFHDSEKAKENLYASLPEVLKTLAAQGYTFKRIPEPGQ